MSTSTFVISYTYTVTYITTKMLHLLSNIIRDIGLDPSNFANQWSTYEDGISTWLASRHLERVTLEIYNPTTNALVTRWDIEVVYSSVGDGSLWVDAAAVRYAIAKAGLAPSSCLYSIKLKNLPNAPALRRLAFDNNEISVDLYSLADRNAGKTPDFKLFKGGQLQAFCEMKSPKDDFVFETPPPDGVAFRENLPYFRKLGGHIRKAARQFDAVNPFHTRPNILAFVSHSPDIKRRDLHATIGGIPAGNGKRVFMLSRKAQEETVKAAHKIDLLLWIDASHSTCQHVSVNGAPHQQLALRLLNLTNDAE